MVLPSSTAPLKPSEKWVPLFMAWDVDTEAILALTRGSAAAKREASAP